MDVAQIYNVLTISRSYGFRKVIALVSNYSLCYYCDYNDCAMCRYDKDMKIYRDVINYV